MYLHPAAWLFEGQKPVGFPEMLCTNMPLAFFFCSQKCIIGGKPSADLIYVGESEKIRVNTSRWTIPFGALI
jgi:hypothetical protein